MKKKNEKIVHWVVWNYSFRSREHTHISKGTLRQYQKARTDSDPVCLSKAKRIAISGLNMENRQYLRDIEILKEQVEFNKKNIKTLQRMK